MSRLPSPILVTGASGLLGTAIVLRLTADGAHIDGLSNRTPFPGTHTLDLEAPDAMARVAALPWEAIVHCAAFRSPDFCELEPVRARLLNALVPERLATLAAERGAPLVHISTDYVFDGTHPPYRETDAPHPINTYGATKLEAEQRVQAAHPGAAILRVPALYGQPPTPIPSPLVDDAVRNARDPAAPPQDDVIVRFPTHVADVARVAAWLLEWRLAGIFHASAPTPCTRYTFTCEVSQLLMGSSAHIPRSDFDPQRKAPRPVNCQLATAKLAAAGGPVPRGYRDYLPGILREHERRSGAV